MRYAAREAWHTVAGPAPIDSSQAFHASDTQVDHTDLNRFATLLCHTFAALGVISSALQDWWSH